MIVQNRSMTEELRQGTMDNTVIVVAPNRAEIENFPVERYTWPYYAAANRVVPTDPFGMARVQGPIRTAPRSFNSGGWR